MKLLNVSYDPTRELYQEFNAAMVALTFIGQPFVVRKVQPVLRDIDPEVEEAAASLGAGSRKRLRPPQGLLDCARCARCAGSAWERC